MVVEFKIECLEGRVRQAMGATTIKNLKQERNWQVLHYSGKLVKWEAGRGEK